MKENCKISDIAIYRVILKNELSRKKSTKDKMKSCNKHAVEFQILNFYPTYKLQILCYAINSVWLVDIQFKL